MYGKIFESMYDGTLASKGPWQAIVTFQQLIVLATQDGTVDMTADAIARRTSIPLEIITTGLAALMQPDPDSRTPDEDGRRIVLLEDHRRWGWRIVNHAKYRDMRRAEERREYLRLAQAKSRAAKKGVNTGQQMSPEINTSTHTEADTKAEADTGPSSRVKTPRKRGSPRATVGVEALVEAGVDAKVAADWLLVRQGKKMPLTQTAWSDTLLEIEKAGEPAAECVRVSVVQGWAGFKAKWLAGLRAQEAATITTANGGHVNKQAALEASNAAVGDAWLKKQMGEGDHASE